MPTATLAPASIRAALDGFLARASTRAGPRWVAFQARVLGEFLVDADSPGAIRPADIAAWQDLRLRQVGRSTVRLEYGIIRAWLRWCCRRELIRRDPSDLVDPPPPPPRREVKFLARDEFARLHAAARSPTREMIAVAVYGGLRPGEIAHLRWGQVNGEWIHIRPSGEWSPKRGRERRVPLHADLAALLGARRNGDGPAGLVFQTRRGTPYVQQDMLRSLHAAGTRAGLDPPPDWRLLRHTFASWLAMDGVSIYHIARFLGHSSVTTTERHYAGLRPEILLDQIGRLGRMPVDTDGIQAYHVGP